MDDLTALVALSLLPLQTWRHSTAALRDGTRAMDVLDRFVVERGADRAALAARAASSLDRGRRARMKTVAWTDPAYPAALAAIADPPPVLWVRGDPSALDRMAVAVVGSRAGTPYALAVAEHLASDLAARGVVVVSGLARGVDSAAHRGALAVGGTTVAVLGSGADVVYPPEHRALAADIEGAGAVVSELVPGTPPLRPFFPLRNRIISGLSRAVVVIEAGERSGSLITARTALEQGRDVLAVPGNVLTGRNRGAHALLRDGARIVETADDILDELGMSGSRGSSSAAGTSKEQSPTPVLGAMDPLLACLPLGEPCDLDGISERSGQPAGRLLPRLLELELRGLVGRVGGGRFVRFDSSC